MVYLNLVSDTPSINIVRTKKSRFSKEQIQKYYILNNKIRCFYLIVNKMKLLLDGKPRNIYFRKDNTAYFTMNGIENDITDYFKKSGGLKKQYSNLLIKKKLILGGVTDFNISNVFDNIIIENTTGKKCWNIKTLKDVCKKLIYIFLLAKIHFNANGVELFIKEYTEYHKIYINLLDIIVQYIFDKESINIVLNVIALYNDSTDSTQKNEYLQSVEVLKRVFTSIDYTIILKKLKEVENYKSKYTEDDDCDEKSEGFYVVKHHMITKGIFKQIEKDTSKVVNTEVYKADILSVDDLKKKKNGLLETQAIIKKQITEYENKVSNEDNFKKKLKRYTDKGEADKIKKYQDLLTQIEDLKEEIESSKKELKANEEELKKLNLKLKPQIKANPQESYVESAAKATKAARADAKQR
jgi:hypothetical protein